MQSGNMQMMNTTLLDTRRIVVVAQPKNVRRVFRESLYGAKGIYTSMLVCAWRDAIENRERASALGFFNSIYYQEVLEILDLPYDWLPAGLARIGER